MDIGLHGRRAVIGGATQGLGLAAAEALANEGCDLVLWARREDKLNAVAQGLRERHACRVHTVVANAADPDAGAIVAHAAESTGGCDVLVLNSGGPPPVDPLQTTRAEWQHALQLLLITPVDLATRLLPGMRARRWGRVIAILSSGVRQPIDNLVYSNAGRAGLAAWLKTVSSVVAADGVTVNAILPGRIDTPRVSQMDEVRASMSNRSVDEVRAESCRTIPVGRYGTPEEHASLVVYLSSRSASYMTGALVPVDGGLLRAL